jgi:hypothetical protein
VKHKTPAMLVRGFDTYGHFDLEPAPMADQDENARAAYARSYDGYRLAYAEQVSLEREPSLADRAPATRASPASGDS